MHAGYTKAAAVTPADGTTPVNFGFTVKALVVGVAGNVSVDMVGGGSDVVIGAAAGVPLPLSINRVNSTSTTATGIVVLGD